MSNTKNSFSTTLQKDSFYNLHASKFQPRANYDRTIEWWFFQGYFSNSLGVRFEFMISFFRKSAEHKNKRKDGHLLLLSLCNPVTGKVYKKSSIDPLFFNDMLNTIEKNLRFKVDPNYKQLFETELKRKGPILPLKLDSSEVIIDDDPFRVQWNDLKMRYRDNNFELEFIVPETTDKCVFTLKPSSRLMRLNYEDQVNDILGKMKYDSIPRSLLEGYLAGNKISGEAWTDHQWGDVGWFFSKDEKPLGWDWFGINLNDGTDLMFIQHNDINNNKTICKYALAQFPDQSIHLFEDIELLKTGYWESEETRINYPVKWRLIIEKIGLNISFSPLFNDQEIHIPGYGRAIWEGAGKIDGIIQGKSISGRGRGEFFGYGFISDFKVIQKSYQSSIDRQIEKILPKKFEQSNVEYYVGKPFWKYDAEVYSQMLSQPAWELIARSGKRWRPIFGILLLEALGKSTKNYERLISCFELIHTGALIVDDVQDQSPLRRGGPSVHLKYGTDVAINTGNTLYFLPSKEIFRHEYLTHEQKYKVHEIMMNTFLESHFGQTTDIYWSNSLTKQNLSTWLDDSITEQILQMYDYKTAAGAKGIAEVAAIIANVDEQTTQICINYARSFAVAFQIIDDIHDFSHSEKWSKKSGEDLKNGKLTFVIAKAMTLLNSADRKKLINIFCNKKLRSSKEGFDEGSALLHKSGALTISREYARNMAYSSLEELNEQLENNEPKLMLGMLCKRMIDLSFD